MGLGHHHSHSHSHSHEDHAAEGHAEHRVPRALGVALGITFFFMLVELIGGFYSNSLALISDGFHMLTDAGAISLSLFVYWFARRPSIPSMTFGYHRVEILGALASGLAIWFIAGFLIYEAILRLSAPPAVQGEVVFWVALIGLVANLLSMRVLHGSRGESVNVRAAYLHLFSDALGSIGAVLAGLVIWLTGWRQADLIVTFLMAALMLVSSWSLVKESVVVLMNSAPAGMDPRKVLDDLKGLENIREVHDLHIWTVASGRVALSVHLIASSPADQVLAQAHSMLKEHHGIVHTTIQVEHPDRFQSERCYDCAQS